MRFQSQTTQRAIQGQIRQAVKPRLIIENRVSGAVGTLLIGPSGEDLLTVLGDGSLRLWDLRLGAELAIPALPGGVTAAALGPRGTVALGDASGRLRLAGAGGTSRFADIASGHGAVTAVAMSGDVLVSTGADGLLKTWSAAAGKPLGRLRASSQAVRALAVDPRGGLAATADGSGRVSLWDLAGGNPLAEFETQGRDLRLGFAGSLLITSGARGVTAWSLAARAKAWDDDGVTAWAALPSGDVATAAGGTVTIRRAADGRAASTIRMPDVAVHALAAAGNGSHLVTGTTDGVSYLWRVADGALVGQIISTRSGWAVIDRLGRYDGSSQGTTDVRWQMPSAALAIDNFSSRYYEPGLLAKLLAPQATFLVTPESVADGVAPPPEVTVSADPAGADEAVLRVTAEDRGGGIAEVGVFVNGRPVGRDRLVSEDRGAASWSLSYRAAGLPGRNQVEVVARGGNGIDGAAATASFTLAGAPAAAPVLHVAVVGINRYDDPLLRLKHAVPDAQGLAARLGKASSPAYGSVKTYRLIDGQASRAGILGLLETLRAAAPQDVVVLYFAGHGTLAGNDWYFLPADADPAAFAVSGPMQRMGFSSTELQASTARLRAQRIVVLVDACRSGALVDTVTYGLDRRQFKEASRQSGIHLLAATQRDQDAIEFDHLGHGAFTYMLLQALKGDPEAQHQGSITARSLIAYVERRLPGFMRDQFDRLQTAQGRGDATAELSIPLPVAMSRGSDFTVARPGR